MKNKNVAAVMTVRDSNVFGANAIYKETVAKNIATPPNIAVGLLCQRSALGFATKLKRRANARTPKVRMIVTNKLNVINAIGLAMMFSISKPEISRGSPFTGKAPVEVLDISH